MAENEQDQAAAPEGRIIAPRSVRQAQRRAVRAATGIHLHSRRNPTRLPQTPADAPTE